MFLSCLLSEITGKLCYKTTLHLKCSISYAHDLMTREVFLYPWVKSPPYEKLDWSLRCLSWLQPEVNLNQSIDLRDAKKLKEYVNHFVMILSMITDIALNGEINAAYKCWKSEYLNIKIWNRVASYWSKSG